MLKLAIAYLSTGVVYAVLDGGWITVMGPKLYRPAIGELLADQVRLGPAVVFYLLFIAGLVYFAVWPGLSAGWTKAALSGALLGVLAYGTYDLTCQATMKTWSTTLTLADMGWGAFGCAVSAALGVLITRFLTRALGA